MANDQFSVQPPNSIFI